MINPSGQLFLPLWPIRLPYLGAKLWNDNHCYVRSCGIKNLPLHTRKYKYHRHIWRFPVFIKSPILSFYSSLRLSHQAQVTFLWLNNQWFWYVFGDPSMPVVWYDYIHFFHICFNIFMFCVYIYSSALHILLHMGCILADVFVIKTTGNKTYLILPPR